MLLIYLATQLLYQSVALSFWRENKSKITAVNTKNGKLFMVKMSLFLVVV